MPIGSATVIGRVAVKVVPDTSGFRGEVKRDLDAIEKGLKVEFGFEGRLNEAVKAADDALSEAQRRANRGAVDLSFAAKGIEDVNRQIDEVKHKADSISGDVELSVARFDYDKVRAQLALLARDRVAEIFPNVNAAAAAKAKASLAALSGGRSLHDLGNDFAEWVGNLDKAVPKMTVAATAIGNLSSLALTGVSNLSAFAGSLATVGGASLALPGILGGAAIGVTAFAVAMKDFNKYVPNFAIGLGKSATAGEAWKHLQDQMSSGFWTSAAKPVRELIGTLFPQFSDGMRQTSTELGRWTANIATSLRGVFNGELGSMFDDLGKSIQIASLHTTSLVDIVRRLGQVGAGNLPKLAHWFGHLTDDFDAWLARKGKAGLQGFVDTGVQALQELGSVLASTGSILSGLYHAADAAGGSNLAIAADTLSKVADKINSIHVQKGLTATFAAAHKGIANLGDKAGHQALDLLGRLADTLQKVLPLAGSAAGKALGAIFDALNQPVVENTLVRAFKDLNKVVDNLAPSMPAVARGLAAIVGVAEHVGVNLSRSLAPALDTLAPAIEGLAHDLTPLVDQLGALLTHGIEAAGPVVSALASDLGGLAQALANALTPVNALLDAFGHMPGVVKGGLAQLVAIGILVGGAVWLGLAARAKIGQFGAALTTAGDQAIFAQGAFYKAGAAAQGITTRMSGLKLGIAGVGLALTGIATQASGGNKAVSVLGSTATGALLGFDVGGPIGAAVGAGAGALLGLATSAHKATNAFQDGQQPVANYTDTLNQLTGAATEATRKMAFLNLQKSGAIDQAAKFGISARELVDLTLGTGNTADRLRKQLGGYVDTLGNVHLTGEKVTKGNAKLAQSFQEFLTTINEQSGALKFNQQQLLQQALATGNLKKLLKGFPTKVVTEFRAGNIPTTFGQIKQLAKQTHLVPKQVKTLVQMTGVTVNDFALGKFIKHLRQLDKTRANPKVNVTTTHADQDIEKTKRKVSDLSKVKGISEVRVTDHATKSINQVQQKLTAYTKVVATATVRINDQATAKINAIRQNLQRLNGQTATINTVHRDLFPGKGSGNGGGTGGGASKVSVKVDANDVAKQAIKAAKQFNNNLLNRFTQDANKVNNTFKQILGKAGKAAADAYRKEFGSRVAHFDTMDKDFQRLNTRLESAVAKVKSLQEQLKQFRQGITDTFKSSGDPTQIGATTYDGIVNGMTLAAQHASDFQKVIHRLIKAGLNKTTLQQLIAAGPEAGLAQAEAIVNGGVGKINKLQKMIQKAGAQVAKEAGNAVFGDLLGAASDNVDKLVKALKPLEKKLQDAAKSLIEALMAELRKELKKGNPKPKKPSGGSGGGAGSTPNKASIPSSIDDTPDGATVMNKTLNYYAAPNKSIDSEESLFDALGKARGGWL